MTSEQQAMTRAAEVYPTSRGFRAAYMKGWRAARTGQSVDSCPYTVRVRIGTDAGWRPAWAAAWTRGYTAGLPD
jgi:ribosome modulation factor